MSEYIFFIASVFAINNLCINNCNFYKTLEKWIENVKF